MLACKTPKLEAPELGRCFACLIRERGICGALSEQQLLKFKHIARHRTYRPGERILSSENAADFLGAINSGVVKVTKILADGRQQIVGLLFPPNCVGHTYGKTNAYFVEAATPVELCCFERGGFDRLSAEYPGLSRHLLDQTLKELESAQDWMVLLGRKTAEEKVASLLLMLATRAAPSHDCNGCNAPRVAEFELHLKRDEIADFLGLTYETVCRQIAALKKRDIVRFSGTRRFSVPDLEPLATLAG